MLLLKFALTLLTCQQFTVSVAPAVPEFTVSVIAPEAVAESSPAGKPTLYVSVIPNCGMCDQLKADIAAGYLSDFEIAYEDYQTWEHGFPVIRYCKNGKWLYTHDSKTGQHLGYSRSVVLPFLRQELLSSKSVADVHPQKPKRTGQAPRYEIYNGGPGSSHANRASLINHLLTEGIHAGQHSRQQLDAMTDQDLDDLHTEDHRANGQVRHSGPVRQSDEIPERWAVWQGRTYDLETFGACGARNCNMCANLSAKQQQYRALKAQARYQHTSLDAFVPDHQQPTPDDMIDRMLSLMDLTSSDVHEDAGCGDGRILIASVQKSGCRGIGVEIDPAKADEARRNVADSGLADRIEIITGDVLDFDPAAHGVTAITAYLYPELLAKLAPKLRSVKVAASPFHRVPGLAMTEHDDVFVYRKTE